MAEAKAKEVHLLQLQASAQCGVHHPGAMVGFGGETTFVPPMAVAPGPDPTRVPLTLGCRRKVGSEYLRCVFLDQAGEYFTT
jgi:hypothetical protein